MEKLDSSDKLVHRSPANNLNVVFISLHTNCTGARLQATSRPFTIQCPALLLSSRIIQGHTQRHWVTLYTCAGAGASHPRLFTFVPRKDEREKFSVTALFFLPRCHVKPPFPLHRLLPVEKRDENEKELAVGHSSSLHHRESCLHL